MVRSAWRRSRDVHADRWQWGGALIPVPIVYFAAKHTPEETAENLRARVTKYTGLDAGKRGVSSASALRKVYLTALCPFAWAWPQLFGTFEKNNMRLELLYSNVPCTSCASPELVAERDLSARIMSPFRPSFAKRF